MKRTFGQPLALLTLAGALMILNATASAATFLFNTDPFEGSTALTTPGRQIVGAESFITFNVASDVFAFDPAVFGIGGSINFANAAVGSLPTSGVNVIVLQTLDNDANPATPFGAGNAANLIADQLTTPRAGFFIYFNSGLELPRLVYSTDLNDNTSDLKILARMTNLFQQPGALPTFTAANFQIAPTSTVPDRSGSLIIVLAAGALAAIQRRLRRRDERV